MSQPGSSSEPPALRLSALAALGQRLERWRPAIAGAYAILRVQSRITRSVSFVAHRPHDVESTTEEGMGLQLFASGGRTIFVSVDALGPGPLDQLLERGEALLRAHPVSEESLLAADLGTLEPLHATRFMAGENVASWPIQALIERIREAHERLYRLETPQTRSMATALTAVDDEWRIFRSDGTDIHFNTWRTSFSHRVTLSEEGRSTSVREAECGHDARMLTEPETFERLVRRTSRKMLMGLAVLRGEPVGAGHYNVILDAGMAKGLAHEAFGHACESDQVLEGSALTRDRAYLVGEQVAPANVSIVDFPMEGDWADQPFSANGFVRAEVAIVERGRLTRALTDIFSGPAIGLASTGAERVERYDCVPLPRMTNIRLELSDAVGWDRDYGLVEPGELFDFLLERRLISPEETWLYLEGYRGGQVNTMTGDYVFNCTAIHRFEQGCVTTHPPAVFSGEILKTLASVRAAVGPLEIMRQGMCGKDGQRVPSSGGGHLFTLFNAGEGITIGGR